MVEGKGSKTWEKAKQFCFTQPKLAHQLLQKITRYHYKLFKGSGQKPEQIYYRYLIVGVDALSPADFKIFAQPYLLQISDALKDDAPVILFPKGSWYALKELSNSSASGLGVDWCISPQYARELTGNNITLQGNFDPAKLLLPPSEIKKAVHEMINAFGAQNYIANLGHGITPNIPVDNAKAFVDAVKEYSVKK
ncbi:MAG: uroporphyrinogen decarboxylase family protein [Chitinophagaceae bacterium]